MYYRIRGSSTHIHAGSFWCLGWQKFSNIEWHPGARYSFYHFSLTSSPSSPHLIRTESKIRPLHVSLLQFSTRMDPQPAATWYHIVYLMTWSPNQPPPPVNRIPSYARLLVEVVEGVGEEAGPGSSVEFNYVIRRSNGYFVYRCASSTWAWAWAWVGWNTRLSGSYSF